MYSGVLILYAMYSIGSHCTVSLFVQAYVSVNFWMFLEFLNIDPYNEYLQSTDKLKDKIIMCHLL